MVDTHTTRTYGSPSVCCRFSPTLVEKENTQQSINKEKQREQWLLIPHKEIQTQMRSVTPPWKIAPIFKELLKKTF